jgi:UDP-2,3-diacylglucosamine hydrolase
MRGNRDIMMGEAFAKQCSATLLEDPTVINLYGTPTLLMHGDSLCTLDIKHQKYRRLTLNPIARSIFLNSPLMWRQAAGRYLRRKSKKHQTQILTDSQRKILDVNPSEVIKEMNQHHCFQLIHGHTHQAKIHYIKETTPTGTRVVLGDWGDLGNVLICTPTSLELQSFS